MSLESGKIKIKEMLDEVQNQRMQGMPIAYQVERWEKLLKEVLKELESGIVEIVEKRNEIKDIDDSSNKSKSKKGK